MRRVLVRRKGALLNNKPRHYTLLPQRSEQHYCHAPCPTKHHVTAAAAPTGWFLHRLSARPYASYHDSSSCTDCIHQHSKALVDNGCPRNPAVGFPACLNYCVSERSALAAGRSKAPCSPWHSPRCYRAHPSSRYCGDVVGAIPIFLFVRRAVPRTPSRQSCPAAQ